MYDNEEIWVECPHYEGNYLISNRGRIFSLLSNKMMAIQKTSDGYEQTRLISPKTEKRRTELVHRLVALAFIPNPERKPEVNHINCVRNDNRVENLEWATRQENQDWKWKTSNQDNIRNTSRELMRNMNKDIRRPVRCIETGEIFYSTYEAAKKNGGFDGNIFKVCEGERHTCNGYHYEWSNEDVNVKEDN